jgi:hypothetical protein
VTLYDAFDTDEQRRAFIDAWLALIAFPVRMRG